MNRDELLQLRERLLTEITPLVIENAGTTGDQLPLLMRLIQSGKATAEIYDRALKSAHSIENVSERLESLMAILDEVEVDITQNDQTAAEESQSPTPAEAQPQSTEDQERPHESYEQHNQ